MSLTPPPKVQKLRTTLHAKAKGSPGYRFYRLYDKVYRRDILEFAYLRCRSNDGARGWTARPSRTSRRTGETDGSTN